jgi:hypothetical protein
MLVTVGLIAFGVKGSGVEGRGASDVEILALLRGKDWSVGVGGYDSWSGAENVGGASW